MRTVVSAPPTSLKEVNEALKLNPDFPEALVLKGILMQHSFGRIQEAMGYYTKAIALRQPYPEAEVSLGNAYLDLKEYDQAISHYERALSEPTYATPFLARANLGWTFYKKGDFERAIQQLEAARTLNSGFCLAYIQLGEVYRAVGNEAEACRQYDTLREKCSERPEGYLHKGKCLAARHHFEEARKEYDLCAEKAKDDKTKDECRKLRDAIE